MRRTFWRIVRVALIPVMMSVAVANLQAIARLPLDPAGRAPLLHAGLGFGLGLVVFSTVSPFLRLYIVGHELSHLIAAKLFRRRTGRIALGKSQGSVEIERPNLWITLAPYFTPFFTFVWLVVGVLTLVWVREPWFFATFYGGIGLTFAYHVVTTTIALLRGQEDLRYAGPTFSLALIVMVNSVALFWAVAWFNNSTGHGLQSLMDGFRDQYRVAVRCVRAFS